MDIFEACDEINELIIAKKEADARNQLIKLLDYHLTENIPYSELLNHLIRQLGLYPYLDLDSSTWQDKFVYEAFKVDTGGKEHVTLHREQSALLSKLITGENIAVSAPTSFGKSFVIDAFISIVRPKNIMIIVPTIALTDETRRRLYKKFALQYKIITTPDVDLADQNIFIFPQERAISYVDKIPSLDILIIDEFYKASSKFDKERSPSLIRAILKLGSIAKQKYFLAPNINSIEDNPFTRDMEFYPLDFNTVFLEQHPLYEQIGKNEEAKSEVVLNILRNSTGKTLIYAGTYANIDRLSSLFLSNIEVKKRELLEHFSEWLGDNYDYNWNLTNLAKRGIGIHNGRLHRSLSQIQVKLFEEQSGLMNLVSTSSIIEGVNTSAENVVIWSNKNGQAKINDFTYRNIMGRGGRMFKHFIGKIYILDTPPQETDTQLNIPFPEQILGGIDEEMYKSQLTKEQIAKIIIYKEEMIELFGQKILEKLQSENVFQTSDAELIKTIAIDMKFKQDEWNGLGFLNSDNPVHWERILYKIVNLSPGGWEVKYGIFVEFVKILKNNWQKSIPELLQDLDRYSIGVDDFFRLEKKVTFKLSNIANDVNILQKELLTDKNYDISSFVSKISNAFLPHLVYQLEEFGLPRMISKKIQNSGLFDFMQQDLPIHRAIDILNEIGPARIKAIKDLQEFDRYILDYFFDGIQTAAAS